MSLLLGNYGRTKPPVGVPLDQAHPLARGLDTSLLVTERGGLTLATGDPARAATLTGTGGGLLPSWSPAGLSFPGSGSGHAAYVSFPLSAAWAAAAQSGAASVVLLLRKQNSRSAGASDDGFCSFGGQTDNFYGYSGDGTNYFHILRNTRVNFSDGGFDKTQWHLLTITNQPAGNYCVYQDAALVYSTTAETSVTTSGNAVFGYSVSSAAGFLGEMGAIYLYTRALPAAEVASLTAAPYQTFGLPRRGLAAAVSYVAAGGTAWGNPLTGETFGLSDARVFAAAKPLAAETLSLSDARALGLLRALSESYALADAHASGIGKGLGDALSLADARALATVRTLTDPLALSDARRLSVARFLGDALALADAANAALNAGGVALSRSLSETLGLSDARSLAAVRLLAEALGLSDARALAVARSLAESLGVVCHADVGATALIALIAVLSVAADDPVTTGGGLD